MRKNTVALIERHYPGGWSAFEDATLDGDILYDRRIGDAIRVLDGAGHLPLVYVLGTAIEPARGWATTTRAWQWRNPVTGSLRHAQTMNGAVAAVHAAHTRCAELGREPRI